MVASIRCTHCKIFYAKPMFAIFHVWHNAIRGGILPCQLWALARCVVQLRATHNLRLPKLSYLVMPVGICKYFQYSVACKMLNLNGHCCYMLSLNGHCNSLVLPKCSLLHYLQFSRSFNKRPASPRPILYFASGINNRILQYLDYTCITYVMTCHTCPVELIVVSCSTVIPLLRLPADMAFLKKVSGLQIVLYLSPTSRTLSLIPARRSSFQPCLR